jgi:hypothetical protein
MGHGLVLVVLALVPQQSDSLIYHVDRDHPNASDTNRGTDESWPWETIVHAGQKVGNGATVLIKAGQYTDGPVLIEQSGGTFRAYPGHTPIIRWAGILGVGVSDVTIDGLMILEAPGKGIRFEGRALPSDPPASGITIANCHTYDTCSSGISIWGIDGAYEVGGQTGITDVIIENNLLELGTHGCHNEIITVANGAENVLVRFNEIRLGDPQMTGGDEGIDFKRGVRNSEIYGNYIHDLSDKAIYIEGGDDTSAPITENILIYNNIMMHLPSAGVVVTTEGDGIVREIDIFNNLAAHNEGDGFRVYDHPEGTNPVTNVRVFNNTAYDNGSDHGGGFRVDHPTATGIVFRNNVAWRNWDYDVRGETETTIEFNLGRDAVCELNGDPLFVDPGGDDFRLQMGSSAVDYGSPVGAPLWDLDWLPRPALLGFDLGCYERQ